MTCGHSLSVGAALTYASSTIGTVSVLQYANNGSGDYSISTAASGYTASSSVFTTNGNTLTYGGYLLNPTVGTYVYKYGQVSGQAYCLITRTGVSITPEKDTKTILNMTKASTISGTSAHGDSGGPFRNGDYFCGVFHGFVSTDSSIVYFTPYVYPYNAGFTIAVN